MYIRFAWQNKYDSSILKGLFEISFMKVLVESGAKLSVIIVANLTSEMNDFFYTDNTGIKTNTNITLKN